MRALLSSAVRICAGARNMPSMWGPTCCRTWQKMRTRLCCPTSGREVTQAFRSRPYHDGGRRKGESRTCHTRATSKPSHRELCKGIMPNPTSSAKYMGANMHVEARQLSVPRSHPHGSMLGPGSQFWPDAVPCHRNGSTMHSSRTIWEACAVQDRHTIRKACSNFLVGGPSRSSP